MDENFDAIGASIETALNDAMAGDDGGPTLDPADEAAGWRVKERKAEPEREPTVEETIAGVVDQAEAGADDAKVEREHARWLRRQSDELVRLHGIDPNERHQHNLSRRETQRRIFRVANAISTDPAGGIAAVARQYATSPEKARQILMTVAEGLGADLAQMPQAERAELQHHRQQQQAHHEAMAAAVRRIEPQVMAFRQSHPDFDELRPAMQAVLAAGEVATLSAAYEGARRLKGLPSSQEAAAKAADEARRLKLASAKAAGTPRTAGAPLRELPSDHSGKSTTQLLEEAYDAMVRA